jgi:hypothetical protein
MDLIPFEIIPYIQETSSLYMILFLYCRSVFDVTKGKSHYGPGGGYHHFSGRCVFLSDNILSVQSFSKKKIILLCALYLRLLFLCRDASRAFISGNFTGLKTQQQQQQQSLI